MRRLAALVLTLLVLPGCRTVQTVDLAPSLEEAVAQTHGRGVRIERWNAPPLRNATRLSMSAHMLSYVPENGFARDSLPRAQVQALTVHLGGGATAGKTFGLIALPSAIGVLVEVACCLASNQTSGFGLLGIGLGLGMNYLYNPDRERVVYRAPSR